MNENYCQTLVCCAVWVAETPEFVIERRGVFFSLLLYVNVISSFASEFG